MDTTTVPSIWGLAGQIVTFLVVVAAFVGALVWMLSPVRCKALREELNDGPEDEIVLEAQREGQPS